MGQAAIAFRRALRHAGFVGDVFAEEVAPGFESLVRPISALRAAPDDVVLYHHGIASGLVSTLLHLRCRTGVVFHNITPARFYAGTRLEEPLLTGRAQLAALAGSVDVAIGVSAYNARELVAAGFSNVRVVPLCVERARFAVGQADERLLRRLKALPGPRLLTVSRVVAHKRVDDVLRLHAELQQLASGAQLFVVGGAAAGSAAFKALREQAQRQGGVTFLGRLSHAELVAAYRAADAFVSMSEHEGFGVPLLEAFAADLPVLAFGAAAVPETLGGRGVCFDTKHHAALAEVLRTLELEPALRQRLVEGQRERLADFTLEKTAAALGEALAPFRPARPARGPARRRRIAVVVQRYGETIVGGAEAHARLIATRLAERHDVTVLTSCSQDHLVWDNQLPEGTFRDGDVTVRRFRVARPRHMRAFNRFSKERFGRAQSLVAEEHWLAEQGPVPPGLFDALASEAFDAVAFFTYLYAPTVWGLPLVKDRALLVPTVHDEPPLAFHVFEDALTTPRRLLCNTPEELALIRSRFPNAAPADVVGVGVEAPSDVLPERFRRRYELPERYLLYVGRMEPGKGVPELVAFHQALVRQFHDAPALVLVGSGPYRPKGKGVYAVGRVDEADKWDALGGALACVVPSKLESLSLVTLEAFAVGTPVLGHAQSPVVAGQLRRSGAGVTYVDAKGFALAVQRVGQERAALGEQGRRFVAGQGWARVMAAWERAIAEVGVHSGARVVARSE